MDPAENGFIARGIYRNWHFWTHKFNWQSVITCEQMAYCMPAMHYPGMHHSVPAPLSLLRALVDAHYAAGPERQPLPPETTHTLLYDVTSLDQQELLRFYERIKPDLPPEYEE